MILPLILGLLSPSMSAPAGELSFIQGPRLRVGFRGDRGRAERIETGIRPGAPAHLWLDEPMGLEITGGGDLRATGRWSRTAGGLAWDLTVAGEGERRAGEIAITLPVLTARSEVFTPGERGSMSVAAYPDFLPAPYGSVGWSSGRYYCLPLVSVFDPPGDSALTIALPADANIPHLQVAWRRARELELRLKHRGMGGGKPSSLRLLLYGHAADYRSVLKAYASSFPRYFQPVLERGKFEGAFWYHHIHDHPDFGEMARQGVRYIWASFWFTHLGEYLPDAREWEPYTFARWWKLGETMSDEKIRSFAKTMGDHGIGTFAYFNVTEYGGAGGKSGSAERAQRILQESFSGALIRDSGGRPIPTWEGSLAMNPGAGYGLRPFLREQVRRHLERLPEIEGFVIDRLDWASRLDYGHDDGFTMVGDRAVENLTLPVADAVQEVCRLAHAAGKRVYVNQFWRVEMLRDVDGYCHEYDYVRGLGYLSPFRPASAWHQARPYRGDLLQFEAQLKRRLQFAIFPQMIAREFPISQQPPDPEAAGLLEIYAPLFAALQGKRQVLEPHCIEVDGANDANLFRNGRGELVVPVMSRIRFLSRGGGPAGAVTVKLRGLDGAGLRWAHVVAADRPPYRAVLSRTEGRVQVTAGNHETASVLVIGGGEEPRLDRSSAGRLAALRSELLGGTERPEAPAAGPPPVESIEELRLNISGARTGAGGRVDVFSGGRRLGSIAGTGGSYRLEGASPGKATPEVRLAAWDDGTWFVPERIELLARVVSGKVFRIARWTSRTSIGDGGTSRDLRLQLNWIGPEEIVPSTAVFEGRDGATRGSWKGRYGARAFWIAAVTGGDPQNGYALSVGGRPFTWSAAVKDARVLDPPGGGSRPPRATCWFDAPLLSLDVAPPDRRPYRLAVYVLDFDRHGREMEVALSDAGGTLDRREVASDAAGEGVYLTWTVTGPVSIRSRALRGQNTVISAVFVDPDL